MSLFEALQVKFVNERDKRTGSVKVTIQVNPHPPMPSVIGIPPRLVPVVVRAFFLVYTSNGKQWNP